MPLPAAKSQAPRSNLINRTAHKPITRITAHATSRNARTHARNGRGIQRGPAGECGTACFPARDTSAIYRTEIQRAACDAVQYIFRRSPVVASSGGILSKWVGQTKPGGTVLFDDARWHCVKDYESSNAEIIPFLLNLPKTSKLSRGGPIRYLPSFAQPLISSETSLLFAPMNGHSLNLQTRTTRNNHKTGMKRGSNKAKISENNVCFCLQRRRITRRLTRAPQ